MLFQISCCNCFCISIGLCHFLRNAVDCYAKQKQCKKFFHLDNPGSDVISRVQAQLPSRELVFATKAMSPLADDSTVKEFDIKKSVTFGSHHFEKYRYLIGHGLQRIFLGTPAEFTFIVKSATELELSMNIAVTESNMSFYSYLVMAKFEAFK